MKDLKRTTNALRKAGYIRDDVPCDNTHQIWYDLEGKGTAISFWCSPQQGTVDSPFRVHGREPDRAEFDCFTSVYVESLKGALRLARI